MNDDKIINLALCRRNHAKAEKTVDNFNTQGIEMVAVLGTNKRGEIQIDTNLKTDEMIQFLTILLKALMEAKEASNQNTNLPKLKL